MQLIAQPRSHDQRTPLLADNGLIDWPDIRFRAYCFHRYRLNKGIYNTIDQWLYDHGWESIHRRRKMLILFLESGGSRETSEEGMFFSFGKGNLIPQLEAFVKSVGST